MDAIRHAVEIPAAPAVVYDAVTQSCGLAGWWTRDLDVATEVGGVSTFRFRSGAFNRMRVVELSPHRCVRWECVDGAPEWIGTRVTFLLQQQGGVTRLEFEHADWRRATPYVAEYGVHWQRYLAGLALFCQGGRGSPDPGAEPAAGD